MRVVPSRWSETRWGTEFHFDNHCIDQLTGYAQGAKVQTVTDKSLKTGYE